MKLFSTKSGYSKAILFAILTIVLMSFSSCEKMKIKSENGLKITTGTFFGECVGRCFQQVTFTTDSPDLIYEVRPYLNGTSNGDLVFEDIISEDERKEIADSFKFSSFLELEDIYGCPDCADGGGEFIEISDGETSHKVTFEYFSTVKGIEKLVTLLRNKREELSKKHLDN
ncbi:hypothetical protein [Jiulongibacter sp. NS-SX5]|uniref:hypothetical protein n=1 Tax=Jiulongibacter sp. NS-SX5 TaxID=3463854 RepID=UPI00405980FF